MHTASDVARFSQFVLGLHEHSRSLDAVALFRWFAEELSRAVGFDCCWCGWVDLGAGRVDACATLCHNLPGDYSAFWEEMKQDDLLARDVLGTGRLVARYDRSGDRHTDGMVALSDRYHLDRMAVATVHQDGGEPSLFLSPYRGGRFARPLAAGELDFVRHALAHLKRLMELDLAGSVETVRILVNREGRILVASRPDQRLVREFRPAGRGRPLVETLLSGNAERVRQQLRDRGLTGSARVLDGPVSESVIEIVLRPASAGDRLTRREHEVATLIAEGRTHKEIARALRLSPATVRNHTSAIYQKTGVGSRAALTRLLFGAVQ